MFEDFQVATIQKEFERSDSFKYRFMVEWFVNIAFIAGYQSITYDRRKSAIVDLHPSTAYTVVANKMAPAISHMLSLLTQNDPIIQSVSKSEDISKVHRATVASRLLQYLERLDFLRDVHSSVLMDVLSMGIGIYKPYFDKQRGERLLVWENPAEQIDNPGFTVLPVAQLNQAAAKGLDVDDARVLHTGDISTDRISPFEFHMFPIGTQDWEKVKATGQWSRMPVEIARETFKDKTLQPNTLRSTGLQLYQMLRTLSATSSFQGFQVSSSTRLHSANDISVMDIRFKPTESMPMGRQIIIAGDKKVYDDKNYWSLRMPFGFETGHIPLFGRPIPGRFWPTSPSSDMRPLQVEHNEMRTDLMRNRKTVGRNTILAPSNSGITSWKYEQGRVVNYDQTGEPPQFMRGIPLDHQVEREFNINKIDFDDISGIHEISRGQNPTGVESGIHAKLLQERDNTKLSYLIKHNEQARLALGRAKLGLVKEHYDIGRIQEIVGAHMYTEILQFMDINLETDIHLVQNSSAPVSESLQEMNIQRYMELGAFGDINTGGINFPLLNRALQLTTGVNLVPKDIGEDAQRKEIGALLQGVQLEPQPWENHVQHIAVVDEFRQSYEFRQLLPEQQNIIHQHIEIHWAYLAQQTQQPGPTGDDGRQTERNSGDKEQNESESGVLQSER